MGVPCKICYENCDALATAARTLPCCASALCAECDATWFKTETECPGCGADAPPRPSAAPPPSETSTLDATTPAVDALAVVRSLPPGPFLRGAGAALLRRPYQEVG